MKEVVAALYVIRWISVVAFVELALIYVTSLTIYGSVNKNACESKTSLASLQAVMGRVGIFNTEADQIARREEFCRGKSDAGENFLP